MVLMSSIDTLSRQNRAILLDLARASIQHGLQHRCALAVNLDAYPEALQSIRATFVTLEIDGQLRGCIGTLLASEPLARDVALHAYQAAFDDPRFSPLRPDEYPQLAVYISVLSPSEPLNFTSEADLLAQLRPMVDGLTISYQGYRATFLPAVWEDLPEPDVFLAQLRRKAGLMPDTKVSDLYAERYTTEYFGDADVATDAV